MTTLKVAMYPNKNTMGSGVSGIHTVIDAYHKVLPGAGIELVDPSSGVFDVGIIHAGMMDYQTDIAMLHGIYFTGEYNAPRYERKANQFIIQSIMSARSVTVPSEWVAETLRRDFKIDPYIVPHGVFMDEWTPQKEYNPKQVLWAKNRAFSDVCDPTPVAAIASLMPDVEFVTTFAPAAPPKNVRVIGLQKKDKIKKLVSDSALVLSTVKETWGLLYIEAMAAGVPVVTVNHGHVPNLVIHGAGGYCYRPNDIEDMRDGIRWVINHRDKLSENARQIAALHSWDKAARYVRDVVELTMEKVHA